VFVDDPERGAVDIRTPTARLPFAGHPLVGVAWLLDVEVLELGVGDVFARQDGEFTWIEARAEWAPPHLLRRYGSAAEVEALSAPPPGGEGLYAWAWEDEAAGRVRARALPGHTGARTEGSGDPEEDGATGAAALLLTAQLGRALNIRQGRGAQLLTAPGPGGLIELGGRVRFADASVLAPAVFTGAGEPAGLPG
jgi:predicted PhzF superfamily epimerase YddE/YHI9